MRELEVGAADGRNSALVDLFDPDHARKVLGAFGRAFGSPPDLIVRSSVDPKGGFEGMRRLLALGEPPTAVFTVNNLVALGAIEAVRANGLEVPDDVALVCFADIDYASRLYPFLTVMAQPAETIGTLGTQLLVERIEGRAPDQTRVVVLPAQFIVRQSCGAARWTDERIA